VAQQQSKARLHGTCHALYQPVQGLWLGWSASSQKSGSDSLQHRSPEEFWSEAGDSAQVSGVVGTRGVVVVGRPGMTGRLRAVRSTRHQSGC